MREQFVRLVDANRPMKVIMAETGMTHDEVTYHLHMMPFHRKYLEVKDTIMALGRLGINATKEQRIQAAFEKNKIRDELGRLWKELDEKYSRS